jgi:hypothetical protein
MAHKDVKEIKMCRAMHLFHEAALAIAVSINLGVKLVHETRLLVLARDGVTGVGVVGVSPGAVFSEGLGKTVLGSVSAVVASEIVVLLTVVTSGASSSGGDTSSTSTDTSLAVTSKTRAGRAAAVGVCTSKTGASTRDTLGGVQLTLAEAGGIIAVTGSVIVVTVAGSARDVVVVVVTRAPTDSTEATSCASTDVLGDTLEGIVALLPTSESSTLSLEFLHGHGRKSRGAVVGGLVVVDFVNRNGGVYNVGLDSLLLNDRLDGLVNVVVDVLAADGSSGALAVRCSIYAALILETSLLVDEVPLGGVVVTVVKLAVLNSTELSSVLLGEDLTVVDGLNCAVVVVLVNLLIDSSLDLLVNMRLDNLVLNSRSNCLVNSGVVVARLGHEVCDSCLSLIHCEVLCG